jgi:hypothetical protein
MVVVFLCQAGRKRTPVLHISGLLIHDPGLVDNYRRRLDYYRWLYLHHGWRRCIIARKWNTQADMDVHPPGKYRTCEACKA